jgi:hypothetical protein
MSATSAPFSVENVMVFGGGKRRRKIGAENVIT